MLIVCSSLREFRMDSYPGFSLLTLSILALVSLLRSLVFLDCAYFHASGCIGIWWACGCNLHFKIVLNKLSCLQLGFERIMFPGVSPGQCAEDHTLLLLCSCSSKTAFKSGGAKLLLLMLEASMAWTSAGHRFCWTLMFAYEKTWGKNGERPSGLSLPGVCKSILAQVHCHVSPLKYFLELSGRFA